MQLQAEQTQCHEMSVSREDGGAKSRKRGTSSGWQVGQVSASVTDGIVFRTPFQRTLRLEEQVFILKDAVATCRDSLRSFVALHEPCVGHKSSRNRHRIPRRTDMRTARRALLFFLLRNMRRETAHVSRDSPDFSFFPSFGWQTFVSPLATLWARERSTGFCEPCGWLHGPRGRPRVFCACTACTHRNIFLA